CGAQAEVGIGSTRFEIDGLAESSDRLVELLLTGQGPAEIVVGRGVIGLELDGLAEGSLGLVILTLVVQGDSKVVVSPGVIRFEADDLAPGGLRLGELALRPEDSGDVMVNDPGIDRRAVQDDSQALKGFLVLALLEADNGQQGTCVDVGRVELNR